MDLIAQNADNSREMARMDLKGAADAEDCGKAVGEAVVAMKSIADRISIIEEIACQTNLHHPPAAPDHLANGGIFLMAGRDCIVLTNI